MKRMTNADQEMLLLSLQREMAKMKRRTEEVVHQNEKERQTLQRENEEMKKKLMEGGPSTRPTNVVGRSLHTPDDRERKNSG